MSKLVEAINEHYILESDFDEIDKELNELCGFGYNIINEAKITDADQWMRKHIEKLGKRGLILKNILSGFGGFTMLFTTALISPIGFGGMVRHTPNPAFLEKVFNKAKSDGEISRLVNKLKQEIKKDKKDQDRKEIKSLVKDLSKKLKVLYKDIKEDTKKQIKNMKGNKK